MFIFLLVNCLVSAPYFYPDSAQVIGYVRFGLALGEMSGNRITVRDSNGNIHAVFGYRWGIPYVDSSEIFYVYTTDGGDSWSEMFNISHTDSATSTEPTLAIDSQDRLHCVWRQFETDSVSYDVYYSMYDGVSWSIPCNITHQYCIGNDSHYSSLVVDSNDNLHLVYEAPINFYNIFYMYHNGISWSNPINISNVPWDAGFPCVAIDQEDHLHAIWRESGIMYSYYNGSSWTTPEEIAYLPGGGCENPCIAVDFENKPHIVWTFGNNDTFNIYYTTRDDTIWTQPLNLSNTPVRSLYGSISTDSTNNLYVVWTELVSPSNNEIYYKSHDGMTWSNIINISQDTIVSQNAKIGNPVKGNKVDLVWLAPYSYSPSVLNVLYLGLDKIGITEQQAGVIKQKVPYIMIHPNPFRETTEIKYQLAHEMNVQKSVFKVKIFNISGQLMQEFSVCNNNNLGYKDISWDGTDKYGNQVPDGVYFVKLEGGGAAITEKIIRIN